MTPVQLPEVPDWAIAAVVRELASTPMQGNCFTDQMLGHSLLRKAQKLAENPPEQNSDR